MLNSRLKVKSKFRVELLELIYPTDANVIIVHDNTFGVTPAVMFLPEHSLLRLTLQSSLPGINHQSIQTIHKRSRFGEPKCLQFASFFRQSCGLCWFVFVFFSTVEKSVGGKESYTILLNE